MELGANAFDPTVFIFGCVGGLLPDVLRIAKNRYDPSLPTYLKSLNFWLGVAFLVVMGGLAAWLLTKALTPPGTDPYLWNALIYGYSAPQLLSAAAGAAAGAGAIPLPQPVAPVQPEPEPQQLEELAGAKEATPAASRFSVLGWWAS